MTDDRLDPATAPGATPDRSSELSDEFWGERAEWTPQRPPSAKRTGRGGAIGRWWGSVLGGGTAAERTHGRATAPPSPRHDADDAPEPGPTPEPDADAGWTFEPESQPERRGGVDPLLARLGGLAVIVTLAAPLIVGFTGSGDAGDAAPSAAPQLLATVDSPTDPAVAVAAAEPASTAAPTEAAPAVESAPAASAVTAAPPSTLDDGTDGSDTTEPAGAAVAALERAPDPEPAATTPVATAPACGNRYELAAGDYWIRLADAADVPLSELLAVNDASVDTVLVPGASICLPVGAATPSPPPTTAAPTPAPAASNSSSSSSSSSSNSSPTRTATTTTTTVAPAPTTTAPVRPAAVPTSQAVQIIRDAWPDDLEERALEIAWRESNHKSNVNNWCCYGLFQIHWNAHKSWLGTVGITSVSQLYDPVLNANAAYVLYQRSGGFGPWGG